MTTEQLSNFLTVARYKNFTKAAEQLFIGQPALSRQIADLENQFGVSLFIRNNRSVTLTPAGEILKKEAQGLLDKMENIRLAMEYANSGKMGTLRLATIGNISKKTSRVSAQTVSCFPDASIVIQQEEQGDIHHLLLSKEVDVGLTLSFLVKDIEGISYRKIDQTRFVALVPKTNALADRDRLYLKDLMPYRKVILDMDRHPSFFGKFIPANDLLMRKNIKLAQGMNSLLLYVDVGIGIGIAPEFVVNRDDVENYSVQYLADDEIWEDVVIAWREDEINPIVQEFVDVYCKKTAEYDKEG